MRLGADSLGLVDRTGTRGLPTIHSNELRPRCRSSAGAHCATIIMGTRVCKNADDDAIVMSAGMVIARGQPTEIQKNAEVLEAYLGNNA